MTIDTRLPAAVRRMLLPLLLVPWIAGATPANLAPAPEAPLSAAKDAAGRYATDPAGAVAALEALRVDPSNPAYAAAGLQLLRAYVNEARFEAAKTLADRLLAVPPSEDLAEVQLPTVELGRRFRAADFAGLEAIEPRVEAASRLDDVAATDRASMLHQLMSI